MKLEAAAQFTAAEVAVDPVAAPGDVPPKHTLLLARRQTDSDITGRRILLVLDAPAGQTLTLELWAIDDATDEAVPPTADTPNLTTRRWYRFATGIVLTANIVAEVTAIVPPGGKVFARRTADTLTLTRTLKATCVA